MSAILRAPNIVPSLFSQAVEENEMTSHNAPFARRMASGWASWRESLGQDADAVVARYAPALAGWSIALSFIGKPLLKAASLAAGISLIY